MRYKTGSAFSGLLRSAIQPYLICATLSNRAEFWNVKQYRLFDGQRAVAQSRHLYLLSCQLAKRLRSG